MMDYEAEARRFIDDYQAIASPTTVTDREIHWVAAALRRAAEEAAAAALIDATREANKRVKQAAEEAEARAFGDRKEMQRTLDDAHVRNATEQDEHSAQRAEMQAEIERLTQERNTVVRQHEWIMHDAAAARAALVAAGDKLAVKSMDAKARGEWNRLAHPDTTRNEAPDRRES